MSDQTIPADLRPEDVEHARSYVQDFLDATYAPDRTLAVARVLDALLPDPPRPTLAGMTPEERAGCRWMQADVSERDTRYVIATPHDRHGDVALIDADGKIDWTLPEYVTPRPDLPRLEWPGDTPAPAAPALPEGWRLADHRAYGRVVVTNTVPDTEGHVYFVAPAPEPLGNDWHPCDPGELTYLDTDQEAEDVTPAPKAGDVIETADDPRLDTLPVGSVLADCDGDDVEKTERGWKGDGYIPRPIEGRKFGPWTVCRIGKEADQ